MPYTPKYSAQCPVCFTEHDCDTRRETDSKSKEWDRRMRKIADAEKEDAVTIAWRQYCDKRGWGDPKDGRHAREEAAFRKGFEAGQAGA